MEFWCRTYEIFKLIAELSKSLKKSCLSLITDAMLEKSGGEASYNIDDCMTNSNIEWILRGLQASDQINADVDQAVVVL
jgi:hypothetical protein